LSGWVDGLRLVEPRAVMNLHESPLEQLINKLGAEVVIKLRPHEPLSDKQRIIKRMRVQDMCEEEGLVAPEWASRKGQDQPSALVVLWDKPVPFRAGHRKYLLRSILGAGVWEDQITHVWAYPFDQASPPLLSQLPKYRPHMIRCLEAADTRYVLSVGALPLSLWRGELKLGQLQGHSGVLDGRWVIYPIANPASVLREPMLQGQWRLDLYSFMDMVNNQEDFKLRSKCVTKDCDEGVTLYDKDGIGWCKRHLPKGVSKAENKQRRVTKQGNIQNQPQMEM
jgi:hypothetical protein